MAGTCVEEFDALQYKRGNVQFEGKYNGLENDLFIVRFNFFKASFLWMYFVY